MAEPISQEDLQRLLRDPDTDPKLLAQYLIYDRGGSGPFDPVFRPNPYTVEISDLENAIRIGNGWSRWRRRRRFERRRARNERLPVIVSEGDSWFQFPLVIDDVIDGLEDDYLVWSCGAAGDTARNIVFDNPEYMNALDEQADDVSAFLLSAAGNDIIGEDETGKPVLLRLLRQQTDPTARPEDLIDGVVLEATLDKLRSAYKTVVDTVRADARFRGLPIIFHGYDYALPFPVGAGDRRSPFWAAKDEWLGGPMAERGINDPTARQGIIRLLIDALYAMLAEFPILDPNIHLVDVRGTLSEVTDWADEIHGTDAGFAKVATRFHTTLRSVIQPASRAGFSLARRFERAVVRPASPGLLLDLHGDQQVPGPLMGINSTDHFGRGFSSARRLERTVGKDDSVPFWFVEQAVAAGNAVCRINAFGEDYLGNPAVSWDGTGFLIAPGVLLTNHHVINSAEVARHSRAVFGYQDCPKGILAPTREYSLDPDRLFIISRFDDMDYCFVWVNGSPEKEFGTIPFWRGSFLGTDAEPANIIHHPRGEPKRISLRENEIVNIGAPDVLVHYMTDTDEGSSGAPVLNDEIRLFALHHAAVDDPALIRGRGGPGGVLNEAIKTSAIAVDLEMRAQYGPDAAEARKLLPHLVGSDSMTGYFGALGRSEGLRSTGFERVVGTYRAAPEDVDVAVWNLAAHSRQDNDTLERLARATMDLNLDIWVLEQTTLRMAEKIVGKLTTQFGQRFENLAVDPDLSWDQETTVVIWNAETVEGAQQAWSETAARRLTARYRKPVLVDSAEQSFAAFPAVFKFALKHRVDARTPYSFSLLPLHTVGAQGQRAATAALRQSLAETMTESGRLNDWVVAGTSCLPLRFDAAEQSLPDGLAHHSGVTESGGAVTFVHSDSSPLSHVLLAPGQRASTEEDKPFFGSVVRKSDGMPGPMESQPPLMFRLCLCD